MEVKMLGLGNARDARRWLIAGLALVCGAALSTAASASEGWQEKWKKTVAAAEAEGELIVSAPSGSLWREHLLTFQKAYPKINMKVTPFAGRDFWPRLVKEREVGQHLWDLRVGGAETQVYQLLKAGHLASVRDMFILPEVADEQNWRGGFDHMFLDNAKKYVPSFTAYSSPLAYYNTKVIKPEELKSFDSLLDPKWKGKIELADPRGGSIAVSMAIVYKKFGENFIRQLLTTQEPVIVKNSRQMMGWFVSGQYPIAMGIPNTSFLDFERKGIEIPAGRVSGLDIWSVGVGSIQVPDPRPHPNATIVFVNWLLTKDIQQQIMKAVELNSRRKDVAPNDPDRLIDWSRYKDYVSGQTEEFFPAMAEFKKLTREILK
jgi:ABC-type Fe3+ transport system substrate-binding protein